ncbi:hypothetical protein GPECTOR_35g850 [Gonium pectorale]|uniref:SUF system FeS cluster assembly SufBD core domain-containing protein n=1 Tax=Gonium pectorale TaxID=33097 RepID=A0A150GC50_GONPE|nr:hypothetical protein GPECTOR_35g850 [Gonium pectorale]|eukprot:KXZ47412.1 hypothetical protein GPECTOR_35g850 [Gonium pectorale]
MQTSIGGIARSHIVGQRITPNSSIAHVRLTHKPCKSAAVASAVQTTPEDKWLARTVKEVATPPSLAALRQQSNSAIATLRMPSTRNEEYRFTDITPLLRTNVEPAPAHAEVPASLLARHTLPGAAVVAVVVDGALRPELSSGLGPQAGGAYVGPLEGAPAALQAKLGSLSSSRGGPFAVLNGSMAPGALAVAVPQGVALPGPVYVLHVSSGSSSADSATLAAPRVLLHAGPGAEAELVEEYVGVGAPSADNGSASAPAAGRAVTVSVSELFLEEDSRVKHSYVQRESAGSFHFKGTLVSQGARSAYTVVESSTGADIARHDLSILQDGPETSTEMSHFLLCGPSQLHDLHSRLTLDHPRGTANQLHKCIVSHSSGKGVFDGNVKVNRAAQQSDAGQLSRNLLLVPLATVNVKPNLQAGGIVADDVKCTHGCAVSDLRDDELFYFRARGISAESARQALVFSFGSEVVQRMRHPALQQRVQEDVSRTLRSVDQFAAAAAAAAQ